MQKAATGKKRPYMASHQRRRALLDVAAEMVGRSGWGALTMTGLAAEAGVSRQLVYDHFKDGTGLLLSAIRHLFEESHRATAEVLRSSDANVSATIREAYRIFLEMPVAQRRALRALSGDLVPDQPEIGTAITVMREEILALWLPYFRRQTGLAERELRPLAWMLISASWGLCDLVDDGTVSHEKATDMLARLVEQVTEREKTTGRRRKAALSLRPTKGKTSGRGD